MKKKLWVILLSAVLFMFAACNTQPPQQALNRESRESTQHRHDFGTWRIIKEATCTDSGERERVCSCGEKETETMIAKGHTVVVDPAVASTCAETGLTEGSHCTVCNEVIVVQKTVPVTAHDIDANTIQTGDVCSKCGYTVEAVSLNQILSSAHEYNNKLVKVTEQLVVGINHLEDQRFYTYMSTGYGRYDYTASKSIDVYYFRAVNKDRCIALNPKDQKITVYGYVMAKGNRVAIVAEKIIF